MSTSHHGASFLPARPLLLAALLLASPLLASPLLGGCGSDGAPPDRPGGPGDVVAVHGLLQLSLLAAPSAPAGEGAGDIARKPQALESGSLSVVALGSNLRTTTVPVDASGEFRVTVKKNTSYTLNLLDNITKQYLASFLYRSGSNISIALKVGDGDVDLGQCQLVEGEVWCANGFFDSPLASGSIEPARDLFGKVRVELEPAPADVPLVERLLGGTTADFEVVPNPENEFHVALFERRAVECGEPLLGVAERVGQERYLYVARVLASDTCRATARYQWVCTMGGQGACSGYYRLDIASSGEDCTSYPPLHVAGPLDLAVSSPGSTECSAPPSCTGHSDCASGICDMDVGFCAAAPPTSALRIYLFDVGNGQSALLVSPVGTSVLLDAGRPQAGRLTSAIARRLTQRLDYMVLSHFDDDHAGGALPFILGPDAMPGRRGVDDDGANGVDDEWEIGSPGSDDLMPGLVLDRGLTPMPSGFDAYARVLGSRRRQAVPGESFDLGGGVQMTVLSANGGIAGGSTFLVDEENERSVGVVVRHGEFTFLDLGDLPGGGAGSRKMEQAVAPALVADSPLDVHLLSHHGSAASSPVELLEQIRPRVALLSVGDSDRCGAGFNSYGLPAQQVLDTLAAVGSVRRIYQTESGGASFTGSCVANSNQTFPRDYKGIEPIFTYSTFLVESYGATFRVKGLMFDDHYQATGCAGAECTGCAAGRVEDPTRPGVCIADPCQPDPCSGHGTCAVLGLAAFRCECTGRWSGPTCAGCAAGYSGDGCAGCAAGFVPDPTATGVCIADPCQPDPCSGHGTCVALGEGQHACTCTGRWSGPACAGCAAGYAGAGCAGCAAGFVPDPTAVGTCIADPCQPDPCSGHGSCTALGEEQHACTCTGHWSGPACAGCAAGYAGDGCAGCAAGFVPDPTAAGTCIADPCQPDPCSGHGACSVLGEAAFACSCAGHWGGPACAGCALGYAGDDCASCAAGFVGHPEQAGACIADPCLPDPCSGHGACSVLGEAAFACSCAGHWSGPLCDACAAGHAGDDCAGCAAGFVADPGRAGECIADPCRPDPCGAHGQCVVRGAGQRECACAGHWSGPSCDRCAAGHAGDDCAACAVGFVADPGRAGECIADPCQPDPCSGHGTCTVQGEAAFACACTGHWSGLSCDRCAAGYGGEGCAACAVGFVADPTRAGECIADPCPAQPCSGHGACVVRGAQEFSCACAGHWSGPSCERCAEGYGGDDCAACAAGYVADPGEEGGCILDPCRPDPCGAHGQCRALGAGQHRCDCAPRWGGPVCAECAAGYTGEGCLLCADGHHDEDSRCVADVAIDGCRVAGPFAFWTEAGEPACVTGLVRVDDRTGQEGRLPGVLAALCWSDAQILPGVDLGLLTCRDAVFDGDAGEDDAYLATLAFDEDGRYEYILAVSGDGGLHWSTCDLDGPVADTVRAGAAFCHNVPNGGFERWDLGTGLPSGWSADAGVGVARQAGTSHSGRSSVRLTRNSTLNEETDFLAPPLVVAAGASYELSMWFLDENGSARGRMIWAWLDAGGQQLGANNYGSYTGDAAGWQQLTRVVTAPAGAASVVLSTRVYGQTGGQPTGGSVFLDDVAVVPR